MYKYINYSSNLNVYFDDLYKWGTEIVKDVQEENLQVPEQLAKGLESSLTGIIDVLKNVTINLLTGLLNIISSVPNMITYGFITILAIIFIVPVVIIVAGIVVWIIRRRKK